jgi:hypothetical protein
MPPGMRPGGHRGAHGDREATAVRSAYTAAKTPSETVQWVGQEAMLTCLACDQCGRYRVAAPPIQAQQKVCAEDTNEEGGGTKDDQKGHSHISDPPKLLQQVSGDEGEDGVLGGDDLVSDVGVLLVVEELGR